MSESVCEHVWEHQKEYSDRWRGGAQRYKCKACGIWGMNQLFTRNVIHAYRGPITAPLEEWKKPKGYRPEITAQPVDRPRTAMEEKSWRDHFFGSLED